MDRSAEASVLRRAVGSDASRIAGLVLAIFAISILGYETKGSDAVWRGLLLRLYYVPILIGAYWYGPFGGVLVALACSLGYTPHLREPPSAFEAGRYAEIVVFHLIGLIVGLLASAQRRVAERYQIAAATLEEANQALRDSYAQLQRVDRLKTLGEVAAGLAHEIRHPLASIRGAMEIIAARSQPDSPEREFSGLALEEVQRLDHLVWEFLRYARPHEPDLRRTPLNTLVSHATALLRLESEQANVKLQLEQIDAVLMVSVDAMQIEQALLNVVLNAIQASPRGSVVRIVERSQEDQAFIDVEDQGPGIPKGDISQIFNPFFTTREKGTGLGLAIAHRIVSGHGGDIDVPRTSEHGTCIRIRLPLCTVAHGSHAAVLQEQA
jgi:two-component system, NtrC family, sensor histidine kinase HydH